MNANYKELCKLLKSNGCIACKITNGIIDIHHIKTRGSGGGDDPWNILPLCRKCHQLWHHIGWNKFLNEYPDVYKYMKDLGWNVWQPVFNLMKPELSHSLYSIP